MDQNELLKQELEQAIQKGDTQREYLLQGELGNTFFSQHDLQEAAKSYEAALAIARTTSNVDGVGATLSNLGNVYAEQGNLSQAIEFYQEALQIAREIGDQALEGNILNNLGLAYERLEDIEGKKEEAQGFYQEALKIARETDNRSLEEKVLRNVLNRASKQLEQIEKHAEEIRMTDLNIRTFMELTDRAETIRKSEQRAANKRWLLIAIIIVAAIAITSAWILSSLGVIPTILSSIISIAVSVLGVVISFAAWLPVKETA
jgi:tetratricopeptide (TPR) repeat protein